LKKRGELDSISELEIFAEKLEKASLATIAEGVMTKDLAAMSTLPNKQSVNSLEFLEQIRIRLDKLMEVK